jgi:hypothetical protein
MNRKLMTLRHGGQTPPVISAAGKRPFFFNVFVSRRGRTIATGRLPRFEKTRCNLVYRCGIT